VRADKKWLNQYEKRTGLKPERGFATARGDESRGFVPPKSSKYRSKPMIVDGVRFASQKEGHRYRELRELARLGRIANLELQPRYRLAVGGNHVCDYVADFRYFALGKMVVEDVKGFKTQLYKLKKRLMKAILGIDIFET
jgi:hypothetical protein